MENRSWILVSAVFALPIFLATLVAADVYQLQNPTNGTNTSNAVVNFTANITIEGDDANANVSLTNISLWLAWEGTSGAMVMNATNATAVNNGTFNNFTLTLPEGTYNWTVSVTYNNSLTVLNGTNFSVKVDTTDPTYTLALPLAGNYTTDIIFNATANDSATSVANLSYGFSKPNGTITWLSAIRDVLTNGWNLTSLASYFADGAYNVSLNVTDTAGNQNISGNLTSIVIDTTFLLNYSVHSPVNNSNFSTSVVVNVTANETEGTGIKEMWVGIQNTSDSSSGVVVWFNATFANGGWTATINRSTLFNLTLGSEGFNVTINATDFVNHSNITNISGITFDVNAPLLSTDKDTVNVSSMGNDGNIDINWTDPGDEEAEFYIIYRAVEAMNTTYNSAIATNISGLIPTGTFTFLDNTTSGANTSLYHYSIAQVDSAGNINNTNISINRTMYANDTVTPKSPTGLNISANGATATLLWNSVTQDINSNPDATGIQYKVYRSGANATENITLNLSQTNNASRAIIGATVTTVSSNTTTFSVDAGGTGSYIFIVTSIDDGGNENLSFKWNTSELNYYNVSLSESAASSSSSSSSSGSGGGSSGGGGGGTADPNAGTSQSWLWSDIAANVETSVTVSKTGIPFTKVLFTLSEAVTDAEITVTKLASKPSNVKEDWAGEIHSYITIAKSNIKDDSVSKVTIEFDVPKKWLTDNDALSSDIVLLRYDRNQWNSLETERVDADEVNIHFRATSPGLSTFAIALVPKITASSIKTSASSSDKGNASVNSTDEEASEEAADVPKSKALLVTAIIIIVLAIGIAGAGFFYYRKSKGVSAESTPEEPKPEQPSQ